jgi:hypothetical protein
MAYCATESPPGSSVLVPWSDMLRKSESASVDVVGGGGKTLNRQDGL